MILTPRELARIGLSHHYPDEFYNARSTRQARRAFRQRDKRRTLREVAESASPSPTTREAAHACTPAHPRPGH